jgi:hypothetical protein
VEHLLRRDRPAPPQRGVRRAPRADRVHEARPAQVREEERTLHVRRQAALRLEQVGERELLEEILSPRAPADREPTHVVGHRHRGRPLDERHARGALVVEAASDVEVEVLVLERMRELVSEDDLVLGATAAPLDDRHRLGLVVVEAGHLLAEDRPGQLAQVGAARQETQQCQDLLVVSAPLRRVLVVEDREALLPRLLGADRPDRRDPFELEPADPLEPLCHALEVR